MTVRDWPYFTIEATTSLYLYGPPTKPTDYSDRIRPLGERGVEEPIDAVTYMSNSPGKFAFAMATQSSLLSLFFTSFYADYLEIYGKPTTEIKFTRDQMRTVPIVPSSRRARSKPKFGNPEKIERMWRENVT